MQVFTTKLLLLFNVSSLGLIIGATYFFANGRKRVETVGWICAAFSICVFAAPLSIMVIILFYFYNTKLIFLQKIVKTYISVIMQRQVIKTKSVEFMPFSLSFFLTICAVVWFFYGFLIHDFYIAVSTL